MPEPRFLIIKGGSLGDIVHTLPSAAALRDTFPEAKIDWAVQPRWVRILEGNADLSRVIPLDRGNPATMHAPLRSLWSAEYTCAIDFQSLYKSALLAFASGAPRRIGFARSYAREGLAALLYTERVNPSGPHKVDHNLSLAFAAGGRPAHPRFPLTIYPQDEEIVSRELSSKGIADFFILNPGANWRSKCWPPERYGELHRHIMKRYGWRAIVSFGPGESDLASAVVRASGNPPAVALSLGLGPLLALLRRTKFFVSADTGPLHLASALGTPAVGLFGPTDPSRNGPYSPSDIVVRNPRWCVTTYQRGNAYVPGMLSISAEQVVEAIGNRIGIHQ